jgi:hypothetical protein
MERVGVANHDGSLDPNLVIGTFMESFQAPHRSL